MAKFAANNNKLTIIKLSSLFAIELLFSYMSFKKIELYDTSNC